jgi:hypothetical protein
VDRGTRVVVIVVVLAALAGFGLREIGFRSGPSTREVTVHTAGPGGTLDFAGLAAGPSPSVDVLMTAGGHGCKPPAGVVNTLLDMRGPKAVFLTEIVPSGQTFRLRYDCHLRVLRMADQ